MSYSTYLKENTWEIIVFHNGSLFRTEIFGSKLGNPLSLAAIKKLAAKKVMSFKGSLHAKGSHSYTVSNFDKSVVFKGVV